MTNVRKIAINGICLTVISVLILGWLLAGINLVSYLRPVLLPLCAAAVLAYLFEPLVKKISKTSNNRKRAVFLIFSVLASISCVCIFWLVPNFLQESKKFGKKMPVYGLRIKTLGDNFADKWLTLKGKFNQDIAAVYITEQPVAPKKFEDLLPDEWGTEVEKWANLHKSEIVKQTFGLMQKSIGSLISIIIGLVLIPIYLYYLLLEGPKIKEKWRSYLPFWESKLKVEVGDLLQEINGYLVAFFRGQVIIAMINGISVGIALTIVGLDFGIFIGVLLAFCGVIPYLGVIFCCSIAILLAIVQGSSYLVASPVWFPLVVSFVFIGVQKIEVLLLAPKILGDRVGLHPLTIILSLIGWHFVLGGAMGALLAIPLTATLKVIMKRYVWIA